jgi:hypothetical protein
VASSLSDTFRERGAIIIHVIIEDGNADGIIDYRDAQVWVNRDYDTTGPYVPPLKNVIVLADTDGGLWARYHHPCGTDLLCQYSCYVTPQGQNFDQGGVVVDDPCTNPNCGTGCGYSDSRVRSVFDQILPAKWCGEATP